MKASTLKKSNRFELRNDKGLGVQAYGEHNDYPQQVIEIVDASGTGLSCLGVYAKFISGKGFLDNDLYKKVINRFGHTNDYILNQISKDLATFGGFTIHLNYNANYKICEIQHVAFEQCRFNELDPETLLFDKICIHPDWGKRFTALKRWKKEDIRRIEFFNPEEVKLQVLNAGGWENYNGQILFYSNQGEKTYPKPIYDPILTDMNTEEGIANVSNRNARSNFLTAGMLVNYSNSNKSGADDKPDEPNPLETAVKEFQGDEKAGKMMYVELEDGDVEPKFVSFKGTNYDKEFNVTLESSQTNIGKAFTQPPILRAENVGANFGADLMKNAYDFYNSVTENERLVLERAFTSIYQHWYEPTSGDYSIIPLSYDVEISLADRLGKEQLTELMKILSDTALTFIQKRAIAKTLFGLTEEESNSLIPEIQQPAQ